MEGRLGDSGTRGGDAQSKLDAAVSGGLRLKVKGARVLYLGARSGLEVSRLLDRVGPNGSVFAVEQDEIYRSDLEELSSKNKNLTVFIKDPRNPTYRIPVLFDALFCDLDHHDKVMIAVNNRRLGLLPGRPVYIFTDKLLGSEKDDMIKYCECPYHV
ncbi:rRNA 2'-O-methyltransferase fibrillarin 1, partial [Linum grandiflorum]